MPPRAPAGRRSVAAVTTWALLLQSLSLFLLVAPPTHVPARAAGPAISVDKSAPTQVLAGKNPTYEIMVTNSGDSAIVYNVSVSDLLPLNATFAGNVAPASAGSPLIRTDPLTGRQSLLWLNLTDLPRGGSHTLRFDVDLGPEGDLVGSVVSNRTAAASSIDERDIPDFDASGNPITAPGTQTAEDTLDTLITAIEVRKSNDNAPEGELLRGVHDQRSVYTLEVANSGAAATNNVAVTDYLPAGLEFLGCGNVDNSQRVTQEYPGSGPLGAPALNPVPCPTPVSVETVADPADPNVLLPAGVYTKVTWTLGPLAPNDTRQIKYVGGIPLRANTTTFDPPAATTGAQAANLDNNTGPSTQELDGERSLRNEVVATGTYTGPLAPGARPEVFDTTNNSVTVEDLRMRKSVSPTNPAAGSVVRFSFTIDTSEYVRAENIVLTDELPDGFCPLGPGSPSNDPTCTGGAAPTLPYDSVTPNTTTGGYTIVFEPTDVDSRDGTTVVSFDALFRETFNDHGPRLGQPTVGGDSFTNRVSLTGRAVPAVDSGESPQDVVRDGSSVTIDTPVATLSKQLKPRFFPMNCDPGVGQPYADADTIPAPDRAFRKDDIVCFKIRIDFPDTIATRDMMLIDFLPPDTRYEPGTRKKLREICAIEIPRPSQRR